MYFLSHSKNKQSYQSRVLVAESVVFRLNSLDLGRIVQLFKQQKHRTFVHYIEKFFYQLQFMLYKVRVLCQLLD